MANRARGVRRIRRVRRGLKLLVWLAVAAAAAWMLYVFARTRPQDLPWTDLDLAQPVGVFTGRKLVALREETGQCRLLLDRAGIRATPFAPIGSAQCRFADGVRLSGGGARATPYLPEPPPVSCPVAAALALWEWHVVQPAARVHLKSQVAAIDHLGSYNCRRMYGRGDGRWSEHATANAVDIAGFRTADGRRISVIADWRGGPGAEANARAAFLREVRDGACDVFSTVLSPDYNEAHRDHFHMDQADRAWGGRSCR